MKRFVIKNCVRLEFTVTVMRYSGWWTQKRKQKQGQFSWCDQDAEDNIDDRR